MFRVYFCESSSGCTLTPEWTLNHLHSDKYCACTLECNLVHTLHMVYFLKNTSRSKIHCRVSMTAMYQIGLVCQIRPFGHYL